jgi:hypothetical protein
LGKKADGQPSRRSYQAALVEYSLTGKPANRSTLNPSANTLSVLAISPTDSQILGHCAGFRHGCSFFPTTEPHLAQM